MHYYIFIQQFLWTRALSMTYLTNALAESLRAARQRKGWTQSELSAASGVPQSHISRIERGVVDLRVSSLVALARILDLELALVPRKSVPAIESIIRSTTSGADISRQLSSSELAQRESHPEAGPSSPAYTLDGEEDE